MNQRILIVLFAAFCLAAVPACKTLETLGDAAGGVGVATGTMTEEQAGSLTRTTAAIAKTFEDITPEQEYYIGRTVGATVLSSYRVYDAAAATAYLNSLGQSLARFSDRPETFAGYHFLILDTPEINAFAAPGGFIFISRGMINLCSNEDELAAVLAHEIAHVQLQHGLQAIEKGRLTSALNILAAESAKTFGGKELAELTDAFEGSIGDITSTMMNSGYARSAEREADAGAVVILERAGYNPRGLAGMLSRMDQKVQPGDLGFGKTHPDPEDRSADIRDRVKRHPEVASPPARQERFQKGVAGV